MNYLSVYLLIHIISQHWEHAWWHILQSKLCCSEITGVAIIVQIMEVKTVFTSMCRSMDGRLITYCHHLKKLRPQSLSQINGWYFRQKIRVDTIYYIQYYLIMLFFKTFQLTKKKSSKWIKLTNCLHYIVQCKLLFCVNTINSYRHLNAKPIYHSQHQLCLGKLSLIYREHFKTI